ncbi:MAG TPA: isoleucine--tRNA ligase [Clostridiales bacterium]|nr:MAG: isoleucine--tRNA ligase [Clostridiales bacterium GWD2_32_19]HCC06966.1 isoleucine--tRNA ligase [Clostridiales bacterium]
MLYKKVDTNLNFVEREGEVLEFWKENNVFKKSMEEKEGCPVFTFYDGPPTANGMPHAGHVITRVIKDIIPRYRTMKGYKVLRKAGWDTHGLPVELEVEKALGLDGKEQIEKYGIEPFVKKCRESVWKYKSLWEEFSDKVGFWVDMEDPYVTYDNKYIESVWWSLKEIWNKELLYKGHKIVPYCPRCGTPLSSHEVAQGYKDVKDKTVFVKFRLKDKKDEYFLAWTTTPWTLPSNVALAVNPNETYVKVKCNEEYYILAEALVESVIEEEYTVVEKYTGKDLEYMEYEPLFDFTKPDKKAFYVACADYVTLTDGTGIVHTAPAFGEDDANTGRRYNLPFVQLVDLQGKFTEEVEPWKGIFVKKADPQIITFLDNMNLIYKEMEHEHSYPHCWRCDTPLLYYAKDTWFIKMTEVKDRLIANNNTINWLPKSIGEGRFGNWIENVADWALSRDRYWGTPLPIWECECGHRHMIGSIEELKSMSNNCPSDIELHKPYIDDVFIKCDKCGKDMKRVSQVIDCWYDSGAMPFAQWHYPFENKEIFDENFPADYISEAVDQTRGWFYSLLAISTVLFDKAAYKNVIVLGHIQDKSGKKMSKSKGNVIEPMDVLKRYGADATRWYFLANSAPWLSTKFNEEYLVEYQRKFMGTLWNTYAFYVLYANIDDFNPTKHKLEYEKLGVMDKWVLSRLNTVIKNVDQYLDIYYITEATRELDNFVDELSNWYVRRSRERFWAKGMEQDKINAYMTLHTVLSTLAKISAPFTPFMAEGIYQNLVKSVDNEAKESIHLCDYPKFEEIFIDKELETNMDAVLKIVVAGRTCRNISNIKNRQPVAKILVKTEHKLPESFVSVVKDELNVKECEFKDNLSEFTTYIFKPQLKTVGPKYGKLVGAIREKLIAIDGNEAHEELVNAGLLKIEVEGQTIELTAEDLLVEIEKKEGYVVSEERKTVVVMETELTAELIEEGFVRELISKIQTMRKEADFEVQNHIKVMYKGTERIEKIIEKNKAEIADEVLADAVVLGISGGYEKEWDVNGEVVTMSVEKIK